MITCPTPLPAKDRILLGHGSGGKLSGDLLRDVFLPVFRSPVLGRLDDQAVLEVGAERLAFTTDSFVVKPLFFRGGDIGSLAVHGTINDLAMGGPSHCISPPRSFWKKASPSRCSRASPNPWARPPKRRGSRS
jgi:hydrogenase expression/formation protein HypE